LKWFSFVASMLNDKTLLLVINRKLDIAVGSGKMFLLSIQLCVEIIFFDLSGLTTCDLRNQILNLFLIHVIMTVRNSAYDCLYQSGKY